MDTLLEAVRAGLESLQLGAPPGNTRMLRADPECSDSNQGCERQLGVARVDRQLRRAPRCH